MPPLRERVEDIPVLVRYFAQGFTRHLNRPMVKVTGPALERLQAYAWPGNVRELEHLVQRTVLLCRNNTIEAEEVAVALVGEEPSAERQGKVSPEEYERRWLEEALKATGWMIYGSQGAAQRLGIPPERLRSRMRKYGLHRPP